MYHLYTRFPPRFIDASMNPTCQGCNGPVSTISCKRDQSHILSRRIASPNIISSRSPVHAPIKSVRRACPDFGTPQCQSVRRLGSGIGPYFKYFIRVRYAACLVVELESTAFVPRRRFLTEIRLNSISTSPWARPKRANGTNRLTDIIITLG